MSCLIFVSLVTALQAVSSAQTFKETKESSHMVKKWKAASILILAQTALCQTSQQTADWLQIQLTSHARSDVQTNFHVSAEQILFGNAGWNETFLFRNLEGVVVTEWSGHTGFFVTLIGDHQACDSSGCASIHSGNIYLELDTPRSEAERIAKAFRHIGTENGAKVVDDILF
jgi:hypothetical protein